MGGSRPISTRGTSIREPEAGRETAMRQRGSNQIVLPIVLLAMIAGDSMGQEPRILHWVLHGDMDREVPFTEEAILSQVPGAEIVRTFATTSDELVPELADANVFLVPEMGETTPYLREGVEFGAILQDFVDGGGIVIECLSGGSGEDFLGDAGFMSRTFAGVTGGGGANVLLPDHPLASGLGPTVSLADATAYWTPLDASIETVIDSPMPGSGILLSKTIGAGYVIAIGYDYYERNPDADRIIGNAASMMPVETSILSATCTEGAGGKVAISWVARDLSLESILITLDKKALASLPITATSFEAPAPGPGSHVYRIQGVRAGGETTSGRICRVYVPYFKGLSCGASGINSVRLDWTPTADFLAILVSRDGKDLTVVDPRETIFEDHDVKAGPHKYCLTAFFAGQLPEVGDCCEVELRPEAITGLSCSSDGVGLTLSWTNGSIYDGIEVFRDGNFFDSLSGIAEQRTYCPSALGFHEWGVRGRAGQGFTDFALCLQENDGPRPVGKPSACDAGADVQLSWEKNDCYTGIEIRRDGSRLAVIDGGSTSYTDSGAATLDGKYQIAVYIGEFRSEPQWFGPCGGGEAFFSRADINADGRLDLTDAMGILFYEFSAARLICLDAADLNDDGKLDLSDPVALLNYLFQAGEAPRPPFGACGPDPGLDDLTCEAFPTCG